MSKTKLCVCCGELTHLSDFFKCRKNLDGLMNRCKNCHKESVEKSRQKNLDKSKATAKNYREKNREKINQKNREAYTPKPKRLQYEWPPPMNKECTKCLLIKSVEEFGKSNKTKHGIGSWCLTCIKEINRERRKNCEVRKKESEYAKIYRKNNSDKIKIYTAGYYEENRNIINARNRIWVSNNYEYKKQLNKNYASHNKEKININTAKRRARLKNATHIHHDVGIEKTLQSLAIRVKNCIGVNFHVDHILPLDCGGYHHHGNMQAIPARLNESKGCRLDFTHPSLIHWTDLPQMLTSRLKVPDSREQSPE